MQMKDKDRTSQAGRFVKMFEENSIMNDYKDVIINNIVVGTE